MPARSSLPPSTLPPISLPSETLPLTILAPSPPIPPVRLLFLIDASIRADTRADNPYQYHPKRYNKHTFDPPPPIREQGGRPRSITPSEVEEIPFESAYIPSLNQPSRHRSRQFAGGREEQDAMDAGCYSFKRSLTRTSLTFRFAMCVRGSSLPSQRTK